MKLPTPEQCSADEILTETHDEVSFATWHPQWGGYVGKAVVAFGRHGEYNRCFSVHNFHDGEFPRDEPTTYHYCNVEQVIEFGLTILEKQVEKVRNLELDLAWIDAQIARLQNLRPAG